MEEQNFIELVDDEGNTLKLEHLLTFENEDAFYAAFLPVEENEEEESDEVIIMRLEEDEKGEDVFVPIEEDDELEAAWQAFLNIYYEEDEDDDEDDEDNDGGDPGKDELGENK
jgi:uncharacterized protein YrzB (UPF0473 family)